MDILYCFRQCKMSINYKMYRVRRSGITGILVKDLAEVLVRIDRGSATTKGQEALREQRTVFLVRVEVIEVARNVVADLPDTLPSHIANAVEWVEGRRYAGNGRFAS